MSVGEALREARESRGLSLEQVSEATRVRATVIRAMEADDFAPCGGAVYARGHIRSVGHVVGIDPEPLVAEFDGAHGGPPGGVLPLQVQPFDPEVAPRTEPHRPNWTAAMVVALVVIIGLALVPLLTGGSTHRPGQPAAVQTPPAGRSTRQPSSSPSPRTVATAVTVLVRVTGARSWFSVRNVAGALLFEGILVNGQQQVFHDLRGLQMVIGNAPAVDLVVNGRDVGSPSSIGSVAHVTYYAGGGTSSLPAASPSQSPVVG